MTPIEIARKFDVPGQVVSVRPCGAGNVNDTYLVVFRTTFSEQRVILQRVNRNVFSAPENIMRNMRVITDHCHAKLEKMAPTSDRIWQLPKIIEAEDGTDFVFDEKGDLWRMISQIASAQTHEKVRDAQHAFEAGLVLGHFQNLISDIPIETLIYTLPGFHITPQYLKKLDAAKMTPMGNARLAASIEARECLEFIENRREKCHVLQMAFERGELVLHPTHGDPKAGNIMIDDETKKGTAIIDLDTAQPGLIHYDFGDCMRSCCNPAGEDAPYLSDVYFDTHLCTQIYKGYIERAASFVSDADRCHFYDAIHTLTLELAIRFFADYLAGDVYFKVRHPGHNLYRALVQMKLVASIEEHEKFIREMLEES